MTTKKKGAEDAEAAEKQSNETEASQSKTAAKKRAAADELKAGKPVLDELVLNHKTGKYSAIPLISMWAKELRKREDLKHMTPNEILELSMEQVLNGAVGWGELKKALANGAAKPTALEALTKSKKEK